jgi:hypothetical protein
VLEYNDEQNQTAKPVLMPIRRRPHDQDVVSTDVGSSSDCPKQHACVPLEHEPVSTVNLHKTWNTMLLLSVCV